MIDYEKWRLPLILLACIQAFLTSGIFYGWAALYVIFLDGGVYSNLCDVPTVICDAQKERLKFVYTVASSCNLVSQLFWGFILDNFGPRKCCFSSGTLVILGFVLLGFSSNEFDGYLPGVSLIAGSGPGVQISLFHLSVLFPENETTVLGVITGSFQLGFIIFVCFKFLFAHGISMHILFFSYCIPLGILLILGLFFWPDACLSLQIIEEDGQQLIVDIPEKTEEISQQQRRGKQQNYSTFVESENNSPLPITNTSIMTNYSRKEGHGPQLPEWSYHSSESSKGTVESGNETFSTLTSKQQPKTFFQRPLSSKDVSSAALSMHSEGETSPDESTPLNAHESSQATTPRIQGRERRRSSVVIEDPQKKFSPVDRGFLDQFCSCSFLWLLLWMSTCIFWANFYIGSVVEQLWEITEHSKSLTRWYSDLFNLLLPVGVLGIPLFGAITDRFGFPAGILLTSSGGVFWAILSMTNALSFQIQTFLLYSFFRTFIFATMFSYIAHEFGYKYFGILSGLVLCCGGLIGFLQYPLQSSGVSWWWIDCLQLASMILAMPYALYVHLLEKSKYSGYQSLLKQIDQHQQRQETEDHEDYYDDSYPTKTTSGFSNSVISPASLQAESVH